MFRSIEGKTKISNLNIYFKKLDKEEKIKSKVRRLRYIAKSRQKPIKRKSTEKSAKPKS